ncbi:adenylate/guanylate cyclase domain-containing protein [Salinimonas sediminis]|uniref:Adenylate/guanylate cyclase domain-containing protein n=1 Tax=Salinimonas sediminis TaxID=2303538 RepID=A0A346NMU4_9ALTE|nr:adenylate/guanylate cyclase domain-containing protein [Salinimonas sediminis]AXR06851.1 adenylate/guanylate cyclase domain-containing protein [Salinimonas sediminis]
MYVNALKSQAGITRLITNISFAALTALVSYSLYLEYIAGETSTLVLSNFTLHAAFFTATLFLSRRHSDTAFRQVRGLFLIALVSTFTTTSILWQQENGMQYFLLLSMVGCDYFFRPDEPKLQRLAETGCLLAFLVAELFIVLPQGPVWESIRFMNGVILGVVSLLFLRAIRRSHSHATHHRIHQDKLIASLLPADPDKPGSYWQIGETRKLDNVSVLFADLQGYTQLSKKLNDDEVVTILNNLYREFDHIANKFGVEKIKTNGDQYMAATGIPITQHGGLAPVGNNSIRLCYFAFAIIDVVANLRQRLNIDISIRIGIASGSVTGGIIGQHKPYFDIWGKTVNLAARLEQHSIPDVITACPATARILQEEVTGAFSAEPARCSDTEYSGHYIQRKSA